MPIQSVFIDRDGTINVEKGYVHRSEDFEYIPGALAALQRLTREGIGIYIVTNQAGIAKGRYTVADFESLTQAMLAEMAGQGIRIQDVLYCPHHPDAVAPAYRIRCTCRKPEPGLLQKVIDARGLDPRMLAMIGDKNSDVEAGRRLGITTYLVETGYGLEERATTAADYVVADLAVAVEHILRQGT